MASAKAIKPSQSEMRCAHHNIEVKNKSDQTARKLKSQPEDSKKAKIFKKIHLEVGEMTLSFFAFLSDLWKNFWWSLSNIS